MIDHLTQLAIHAYYAGELDTGRRACERLLSMPLPEGLEQQTRANRTWYTRTLADLAPSLVLTRIDTPPAHDGWSLFNPALLADGEGAWCIVRSSNYRIDGGRYVIPEADGERIRTENILGRVDAGGVFTGGRVLTGPDYATSGYPVHGLEDCRLRRTASGVGVSATCRNVHGWDGRCRQVVCSLDTDTATLSGLRVLESGVLAEHEKNWMPIESRGGWLYAAWHDGHAVTVDEDPLLPGTYEIARRAAAPQIASRFRGGSQLVPFREGYLAVIHEVAAAPGGRVYEHRLAWWDAGLALRRVSEPFAFRETRAIEFAAGAAILGDRLLVSLGVRDAEAWIASLSVNDVCQLLAPVS